MTRQEEKQQLRAIVRRLEAALTPEYKAKSSRAIVWATAAGITTVSSPSSGAAPFCCAGSS